MVLVATVEQPNIGSDKGTISSAANRGVDLFEDEQRGLQESHELHCQQPFHWGLEIWRKGAEGVTALMAVWCAALFQDGCFRRGGILVGKGYGFEKSWAFYLDVPGGLRCLKKHEEKVNRRNMQYSLYMYAFVFTCGYQILDRYAETWSLASNF